MCLGQTFSPGQGALRDVAWCQARRYGNRSAQVGGGRFSQGVHGRTTAPALSGDAIHALSAQHRTRHPGGHATTSSRLGAYRTPSG